MYHVIFSGEGFGLSQGYLLSVSLSLPPTQGGGWGVCSVSLTFPRHTFQACAMWAVTIKFHRLVQHSNGNYSEALTANTSMGKAWEHEPVIP